MIAQPQDLVNRALDILGAGTVIGNMFDGTKESEAARRAYGPLLRQLLQTANWGFARKMDNLQLLADATGNTLDPATAQPISATVEVPWTYAYAWPIDGVRARWLPWNMTAVPIPSGNIAAQLPNSVTNSPPWPVSVPARFLVATSEEYPVVTGLIDWDNLPDLHGIEGVGLTGRRIVLTDITNAQLVYTKLVTEIEQWDDLFTEAMVAVLAMRLALVTLVDGDAAPQIKQAQRAHALQMRAQQVALAQNAIREARVANANDQGFPQTVDNTPDWIRARRAGAGSRGWGNLSDGPGYTYLGWAGFGFDGGAVF